MLAGGLDGGRLGDLVAAEWQMGGVVASSMDRFSRSACLGLLQVSGRRPEQGADPEQGSADPAQRDLAQAYRTCGREAIAEQTVGALSAATVTVVLAEVVRLVPLQITPATDHFPAELAFGRRSVTR